MIGYILTQEQYEQIQGKHFSTYECFNCVEDINNVWFTFFSDQQKETILQTDYDWLFDLPQAQYTPPPSPDFPI